jgi:hypothetical protein
LLWNPKELAAEECQRKTNDGTVEQTPREKETSYYMNAGSDMRWQKTFTDCRFLLEHLVRFPSFSILPAAGIDSV